MYLFSLLNWFLSSSKHFLYSAAHPNNTIIKCGQDTTVFGPEIVSLELRKQPTEHTQN